VIARIAPVLLAVCLLAAWQSAALHPLQHVDADGRLVHMGDSPSKHDGRSTSDPSSKLCNSLAALTACVDGAAPLLAFLSLSEPGFSPPSAPAQEATRLNPNSRDPPLIS
jgi:hypothetical protein